MLSSAALDVAFGLALVFLLFSVAASKINETIASVLNIRHQGLEKALISLVGSDGSQLSASKVMNHDLITPMQAAANSGFAARVRGWFGLKAPGISYLPARTFSAAVLDLLAPADPLDPQQVLGAMASAGMSAAALSALAAARADPSLVNIEALCAELPAGRDLASVQALAAQLRNDPLQRALSAVSALGPGNPARQPMMRMLADARGDRNHFRQSLEHWYDDTMDRVSGWYKRYVQRIILVISIVLVASLNIDSINLAQELWRLPTERAAVASAAAAHAAGKQPSQNADQQIRDISALQLPLGWTPPHSGSARSTDPRHVPLGPASWLIKFLGLLLTVLALSLGAPFWFDALSKLGSLRQSGPKPVTSAHK
jgi:hypothetical protein